MSAVLESPISHAPSARSDRRVNRLEIFTSFEAAECAWVRLGSADQLSTPYQTYDFVKNWQTYVGPNCGCSPFVVVAYDHANEPLLLLPLVRNVRLGFSVACFPGGKHSNFNMGLWRRDFALNATKADVEDIIKRISEHSLAPDVLTLSQQPIEWDGVRNPLALLPRQVSVNECPLLTLDPKTPKPKRFGSNFRRRLNGKEKKLQALPGYRYVHATTQADANRLLEMFFALKPQRMAEQKIRNVFAEPGVEDFIRHACLDGLEAGKPAIALHGLVCDDEVIAMFGGVGNATRFSTMFNTYTLSEASRNSPGLVLLRNIIDHYADQGCPSFDFGVGTDSYKLQFCKERLPLFDSFLPLNGKGRLGARLLSLSGHVKRIVKQSPLAMKAASLLRVRGS